MKGISRSGSLGMLPPPLWAGQSHVEILDSNRACESAAGFQSCAHDPISIPMLRPFAENWPHAIALPLVGRGWGWGSGLVDAARPTTTTPLPSPPPQGGREHTEIAARADSIRSKHALMRRELAELSITDRWTPQHGVPLRDAFWVWLRVAMLSFGGPAGQIAVMHRILVEEKRWISESRFLHALNYCMLLPGPESQQLATYIGWLMHRTLGGIIAGGLFVIPGILAIMALSYVYAAFGNVPVIVALFFGLKAAVLAIVLEAVVRIGKRSLKNDAMRLLAAVAFIGIFFLALPFPLIILAAALIGFVGAASSAQIGRAS